MNRTSRDHVDEPRAVDDQHRLTAGGLRCNDFDRERILDQEDVVGLECQYLRRAFSNTAPWPSLLTPTSEPVTSASSTIFTSGL